MGRFSFYTAEDGLYYFKLLSANGQVLLESRGYRNALQREQDLQIFLSSNAGQFVFERRHAANGKFYFALKSLSGEIIGISTLYNSEASRDNGIEAVKNYAMVASV